MIREPWWPIRKYRISLLKIVFLRYQGWKADSTKVVVDSFPLFRFFVERIWRRNCRFDSFQLQMKYIAASVKARHLFPAFFSETRSKFETFFFFDESLDIVFSPWSSVFIRYPSISIRIERSAIDTNLYSKNFPTSKRKRSRTSCKIWEPVTSSSFSHRTREIFLEDALPLKTIYSGTIAIFQGENLGIVLVNVVSPGGAAKETKRECTRFRPTIALHLLRNTILCTFPVTPCGFAPYGYGTKTFPSPRFHYNS